MATILRRVAELKKNRQQAGIRVYYNEENCDNIDNQIVALGSGSGTVGVSARNNQGYGTQWVEYLKYSINSFSFMEIYDLSEDGDLQKIVYSDSSLTNYQKFPELFIVDPDFCLTAK